MPGSGPRIRAWHIVLLAAILAFGAYASWRLWKHFHHPPVVITAALPAMDLTGYDPEIVAALRQAREAVSKAPQSGAAWGKLGQVLMVHRFHKEAISALAQAARLDPREPRWPYLQGIIMIDYDPDGALPLLQAGADLAPHDVVAPRLRVANLFIERGRLEDARKYVEETVAADPQDPRVLLAQGKLTLFQGDAKAALPLLERCAENPATAHEAEALIGTTQQRLGDTIESQAAAKRAAALPPDPGLPDSYVAETHSFLAGQDAWIDRADHLIKGGDLAGGINLLQKAVALNPDKVVALQKLGWGELTAKDYVSAEHAFQRWTKVEPQSDEAWFQLGNSVSLQGRRTEAMRYYRKAIELAPGNAFAHYDLGILLADQHETEAALAEFREALRYKPDFGDAYKRLGGTLALAHRYTEALEPFQRALDLDPADAKAKQMLELAKKRGAEQKEKPAAATPPAKK